MTTTVFEVADEVVVEHHEAASLLVVTWARWSGHAIFTACLDAQADVVEAGRARHVIVDVQAATGAPSAMDHDYVRRFAFPRFRAGGLQDIVIVRARNGHTRIATQNWVRNGRAWRFDVHEVDSAGEAHRLVRSRREP